MHLNKLLTSVWSESSQQQLAGEEFREQAETETVRCHNPQQETQKTREKERTEAERKERRNRSGGRDAVPTGGERSKLVK